MKLYTRLLSLTSFLAITLLTGCGQSTPSMNTNIEAECLTINKNLLKIDKFTQTVENTSAFHLEESAVALQVPRISVSNNKRQMLRDAEKRRVELEAEHKKFGCDVIVK
ncbi:hypothetical protein C9926_02860 [Sulfurovum lithotrophicum]|nr:hypothetical protein C9926_02860 [Sulfurovum lithotrophicum]